MYTVRCTNIKSLQGNVEDPYPFTHFKTLTHCNSLLQTAILF